LRGHTTVSRIEGRALAGGEPLADVTVTVRHAATFAIVARTTTTSSGAYAFDGVPDGWYQLDFCRAGLNTVVTRVHVQKKVARDMFDVQMSVAN
jgi:hypothetical protein